ncbi:MAG TPA: SgcJ/EcaC family oxidoreductase [Vicinamibacteria bacterium]
MIRAIYGSLVLVLFSLTACQPPAEEESPMPESEMSEMGEPAGLSPDDLAAIQATTQAWEDAALANDFEALAATYTQDAKLMPPNHDMVQGRAAIQDFMGTFPPITDMELDPIEVEGAGDIAYVRGNYKITMAPEGGEPISDSGKYLEIRRKQSDGAWLLSHDLWNSDQPLPQ